MYNMQLYRKNDLLFSDIHNKTLQRKLYSPYVILGASIAFRDCMNLLRYTTQHGTSTEHNNSIFKSHFLISFVLPKDILIVTALGQRVKHSQAAGSKQTHLFTPSPGSNTEITQQ